MPWWFWVCLIVTALSSLWLSGLGMLYAWAVYGPDTWARWMAEDESGQFGPYVPRWRQQNGRTERL